MDKPSKPTSLDKLKSKARQTQAPATKTDNSDIEDVFDSMWAGGATRLNLVATPPPPVTDAKIPSAETAVEKNSLTIPASPQLVTAPASDIVAPSVVSKNVPTTVSENIFAQFRVAYNEHKFFAFLLEYGTVLQEQAISQTQIASLLGLRAGTFKQLAARMKEAGMISAESATWHKKGVTYKANEPFIEQFHAIYQGKFPKNKKAFKAFHEARIEAEFKRSGKLPS